MEKNVLAICGKDQKYIQRLSEILKLRTSFPFQIATFESVEILLKQSVHSEIELVLIEEAEYQNVIDKDKLDIKNSNINAFILLVEGKRIKEIEYYSVPQIYKYQSGENIRKEVLRIYGQIKEESINEYVGHKQTKIIGIYSPIGRCLQTSFSLLLGQFLAKKKKVLYLNFEPFSGLSQMLGCPSDKDITDLIFALRGNRERLTYQMESMIMNINGLDYIAPAASFIDLASITEENWIILLEAIKAGSIYDYVILDLSEVLNGLLNILRSCNLIYTIENVDGFARAKMMQYENILTTYEYEDVKNKTRKFELPKFKHLPSGIEQLPYSELANYVKEKIIEEAMFEDFSV